MSLPSSGKYHIYPTWIPIHKFRPQIYTPSRLFQTKSIKKIKEKKLIVCFTCCCSQYGFALCVERSKNFCQRAVSGWSRIWIRRITRCWDGCRRTCRGLWFRRCWRNSRWTRGPNWSERTARPRKRTCRFSAAAASSGDNTRSKNRWAHGPVFWSQFVICRTIGPIGIVKLALSRSKSRPDDEIAAWKRAFRWQK